MTSPVRRYGLAATLVIVTVAMLFGFAPVTVGSVECGSAWVPSASGDERIDQQCEARTRSRRLQSFVIVVAGGVVLASYLHARGPADRPAAPADDSA